VDEDKHVQRETVRRFKQLILILSTAVACKALVPKAGRIDITKLPRRLVITKQCHYGRIVDE
jgi:hypothetical protein